MCGMTYVPLLRTYPFTWTSAKTVVAHPMANTNAVNRLLSFLRAGDISTFR